MFMHAVIPENRLVSRDQRPKTFPSLQINFLFSSQECACLAWTSSWSWFILKGVGGGLFIGLKSDHPASCDLVSLSATVHTTHSRPGFRNNLKGGSESHRLLEIIKSGHGENSKGISMILIFSMYIYCWSRKLFFSSVNGQCQLKLSILCESKFATTW